MSATVEKEMSREEFAQAYDDFVKVRGVPPDHVIVIAACNKDVEHCSLYWSPSKSEHRECFESMIAAAIDALEDDGDGNPEHG